MLNHNSHIKDGDYTEGDKQASFMELALEGERRCKKGDCVAGVQYLESAIKVQDATEKTDYRTLSAIYSQLGNAYFYLQDYAKAFEYHKLDLQIACEIGDKIGEAKASGNLGNTLKVLGKFEEAIMCCERHLFLSKELGDRVGEGRAFYNLGNVYHAKGKHLGKNEVSADSGDAGDFPTEVKEALTLATKYYQANLQVVLQLEDVAAQGRAYGNLGNTYHLLSKFSEAIECHKERQLIAAQLGDKAAERRAFSNMGNAYIFIGDYDAAIGSYAKSLEASRRLSDAAMEAQASFSLGNTFMLMKRYDAAVEHLANHLKIAQDLRDKVGESRALWCLSTALTSLGSLDIARGYAQRHLEISRELGDVNGVEIATQSLQDLSRQRHQRPSNESAEALRQMDDSTPTPEIPPKTSKLTPKSGISGPSTTTDQFFDYLSRVQGNRLDDQRCTFNASTGLVGRGKGSPPMESDPRTSTISVEDELLLNNLVDLKEKRYSLQTNAEPVLRVIERSNKARYDDQRTSIAAVRSAGSDEEFFSLLSRIQSSRIEDQRSNLPPAPPVADPATGVSSQSRNSNKIADGDSVSNRSATPDGLSSGGIFKRLPRLSKKKKQ